MNKIEEFRLCLFSGITENIHFSEILASISKNFNIKIYFCDMFGRVRIGEKTNKFYEYMSSFTRNNMSLLRSRKPLLIRENEIDEREYYFCRVADQTDFSMIVIEHSGDDSAFLESAVEDLSKTFYIYQKGDARLQYTNDSFNELLSRELLLESDDTVEKMIHSTANTQLFVKAPYRILCFSSGKAVVNLSEVSKHFAHYLPSSYVTVSDGLIFAFIYGAEANIQRQSMEHRNIKQYCSKYNLKCCISSIFNEIKKRQNYLTQAKKLLPVCSQVDAENNLFFADDYFCEYMLLQASTHLEPGTLNLTIISYLDSYDRENGTQYLQTLKCYLNNQLNAAAAARELFIDRTTLKYRLRKIDDLIHVKIDDYKTTLALKLGLILFEMEKRN